MARQGRKVLNSCKRDAFQTRMTQVDSSILDTLPETLMEVEDTFFSTKGGLLSFVMFADSAFGGSACFALHLRADGGSHAAQLGSTTKGSGRRWDGGRQLKETTVGRCHSSGCHI